MSLMVCKGVPVFVEVCGGEKVDEGSVKAIFGGCVRSGGGGAIGA